MIISASRRTDIPTYYSEWFLNRIKEGYAYVRNPMNIHQISKVSLSLDVIDGIVFWTKNPIPMIEKLSTLDNYTYYFQFTITPYDKDVEPNIPSKKDIIIPAFKELSDLIGPSQIIWRYDPILLNAKYTLDFHINAFEEMASCLHKHTRKCTISFLDFYRNTANNMKQLHIEEFTSESIDKLSKALSEIAHRYDLRIDTCAEAFDLKQYGIEHARCIDERLFETLINVPLRIEKDKNQRHECGCVASVDIGMYNTCRNGCRYCYANYSEKIVANNSEKHNPDSPLLFGAIGEDDVIKDREMASNKELQLRLEIG